MKTMSFSLLPLQRESGTTTLSGICTSAHTQHPLVFFLQYLSLLILGWSHRPGNYFVSLGLLIC